MRQHLAQTRIRILSRYQGGTPRAGPVPRRPIFSRWARHRRRAIGALPAISRSILTELSRQRFGRRP
jgi:hypothetical protein